MRYNYRFHQRLLTAHRYRYLAVASFSLLIILLASTVVWSHDQINIIQWSRDLLVTTIRIVVGYLLACAVALVISLLMRLSLVLRGILYPILDIAQSIPGFAILLVLILYVGLCNRTVILALAFVMVWPILFALLDGLGELPSNHAGMAQLLGARGLRGLMHYWVPLLRPSFIVGSILAWGEAWNIAIGFEIITHIAGVGTRLADLGQHGQASALWFGIGAYVLLIFVSDQLIWIPLLRRYGPERVEAS